MKPSKIASHVVLSVAVLVFLVGEGYTTGASPAAGSETVLTPKDIGAKLFPEKVFFRGQLATTQLRNTGGVRFADDVYLLAGLCDNAGYAADVKEKFQGYLLSEVPLEIAGQPLRAGAYAFGVVDGRFIVMDLGANDVLKAASMKDTEMKHPTPLQVLAAAQKGVYRLYVGREYVELQRAK